MRRSTSARWLLGPAGAMLYAALIAGLLFFRSGAVPAACAAPAPRAVDLRFLLVGPSSDFAVAAWESAFTLEGVPYVRVDAAQVPTVALTAKDGTALYGATVVANSTTLTPAEDARLAAFERAYRLRRIVAFTATPVGPVTVGAHDVQLPEDGAVLTTAGRTTFPYLRGPVPIDNATGRPQSAGAGATVLVAQGGRSLLTEWTRGDGVSELLMGARTSAGHLHQLLLAPGMIAWALQGVVPGSWQPYFDVHVDDVLLPSFTWISSKHASGYSTGELNPTTIGTFTVRMTPADVDAAAAWEKQERFTLDLGLNGYGLGSDCDALTRAVVHDATRFRWFNHTYQHLNFDFLDPAEMTSQIVDNVKWARQHRVVLDPAELVTGQQSGLHNPHLSAALAESGVRVLAADASRDPLPLRFGDAVALPRHPMNVYQDASTRAQELDEFNYRYVTSCGAGRGCLPQRVDWQQFVANESTRLLRLVLANDPRPSYAHQSNLARDRILLDVLTRTLARYRALVRTPFAQPTMTASLRAFRLRLAWANAVRLGRATVTRHGNEIVLGSSVPVEAPLLLDGKQRWIALTPGVPRTVVLP